MTNRLRIVDATPALLEQFYGKPAPFTLRGHVAMIDDRVVGVGGVHYLAGMAVVFSDYKDMGRKDRVRCFRFLEQHLAKWRGRLCAVCDPNHPVSSRRLLERLGFEDMGNIMVRTWRP